MKQTIQSTVVGSLKLLSAAAFAALLLQSVAANAQTLRPSSNGRYVEWSDGTPVFLLSDTCWLLPGRYSTSEVSAHAATRKSQGYTALQMTVCFPEVQNGAALQDINRIFTSGDMARPITTYFDSVDAKIRQVTSAGLIAIVNPFWKKGSDAHFERNGATKCRNYGKWLATRHRTNRHVAWFIGGDDRPEPVRSQVEAMGLGIQDAYREAGLPAPIIAYHGDPGQASREAFPSNPSWLTLEWTYSYSEPLGGVGDANYIENWAAWPRTPTKPIMHGEGWYDRDNGATQSSRWNNRHGLRRQCWHTVLAGSTAGYAYGAEPIWLHRYREITPATAATWNSGKDAARMKTIISQQQWWRLRPDLNGSFISGSVGSGIGRAIGATADDGSFGMAYTPVTRTFSLRMPGSGRTFNLNWHDPASGATRFIRTATSGTSVSVTSPGTNSSGQQDWVLVASSGPPGNMPPIASITSPTNNATIASGSSITINATASDSDGTVTQVVFRRGSTVIGTDTSSPYSVTWSGAADGSYALTAVATDDDGATGTSSTVNITVGTSSNLPPNGTYKIINRASLKAMDVTGGRIEDNTPVIQYTYSGSTNQQWVITDVGSSQKTLRGVKSGRYLDVIGASTADGIATQILGTTGTANNQRFTFTATDSGNYVIKAVHSGKALQPRGASLSNGAVIEQSTSTNATHQQWAPSAP